jgi:hypothetical protein
MRAPVAAVVVFAAGLARGHAHGASFSPPMALRFATIHSDGMILQAAPLQSTVWGYGGSHVQIAIDGGTPVAATRVSWLGMDSWLAKLPPQPASFTEHNITATSGTERVQLRSVRWGDVYLCAGQSNMDYPINGFDTPGKPGSRIDCWDPANVNCTLYNDTTPHLCARRKNVGCLQCHYGCVENAQQEVHAMAKYDGRMRLNVVAESGAHFPVTKGPLAEQKNSGWQDPSRMGGGFSAACFFWGRDMMDTLEKHQMVRPLGLIQAAVGGTSLQFWSSDRAIARCQGTGDAWQWPRNFRNGTGNLSTGYKLPDIPTGWNAKIYPLLRTTIKGAIWYQVIGCLLIIPIPLRGAVSGHLLIIVYDRQGESNTGEATPGGDARQYLCGFNAMIDDWREQWHVGTGGASDLAFPFGWLQLNSCFRAVWEESRTQPPVPIATNWSYQNPKVQPGAVDDPLGEWRPTQSTSSCSPSQPRGTPCRGQGDGFPSVRWAFTQSLARVNQSFQAVILDTPSAYGSVHSPFKQIAGSRLARAALATIYGLSDGVSPFVTAVTRVVLDATSSVVKVSLGGLGPGGIEPPRSAAGFELLCKDDVWHSALCTATAVAGATITLQLPHGCEAPRAVRYLWYDTPCGNDVGRCPIYTATTKLGGLSGEQEFLPLGPFIKTIQAEELAVRTKTDDEDKDKQTGMTISCDIVIAGGSTASLAAAITAAEAAPELHVCFTDPTDWPGGQMTAGELRANQPACLPS